MLNEHPHYMLESQLMMCLFIQSSQWNSFVPLNTVVIVMCITIKIPAIHFDCTFEGLIFSSINVVESDFTTSWLLATSREESHTFWNNQFMWILPSELENNNTHTHTNYFCDDKFQRKFFSCYKLRSRFIALKEIFFWELRNLIFKLYFFLNIFHWWWWMLNGNYFPHFKWCFFDHYACTI